MRFAVLPVLTPALLESFCLRLLRKTGNKVGMAGCDAFLRECLGYLGDQLKKRETGIDVACALAGLLDQSGYIIAGEVEQALEALRLFVRMNVDPLRIFNQLPFLSLRVIDLNDACWNRE
jgi:hypothetical protein